MGPNVKPGTTSPTVVEDDRVHVSMLERHLQAHIARTSHIQARLMTTLTALDTLKASHAVELSAEKAAKERLSEKLDCYIDYVKVTEAERDDLLDAVNLFIQKIEDSNDYSSWPCSRMTYTSLVDPINTLQADRVHESDEDISAYFPAIVSTLRMERDIERQTHRQTIQEAEKRIAYLEAKVAHYEAELEMCVMHTGDCFKIPESSPPGKSSMTEEEVVQILELVSRKHAVLEAEIKALTKRALSAASPSHLDSHAYAQSQSSATSSKQTESPIYTPTSSTIRSTPRCLYAADADQTVKAPSSPIPSNPDLSVLTPLQLFSPSPVPLSLEQGMVASLDINHVVGPNQAIDERDNQIALLGRQVMELVKERERLRATISEDDLTAASVPADSGDKSRRLTFLEQECARVGRSGDALRVSLEASTARQTEILDEIASLRSEDPLLLSPGLGSVASALDDDLDGETAMELATPLQPTVLSMASPPVRHVQSPYIDPPTIPLPESPLEEETFTIPSSNDPADAETQELNIDRIKRELEFTRRQVQEGEQALSDLRDSVEEVRRCLDNRVEVPETS